MERLSGLLLNADSIWMLDGFPSMPESSVRSVPLTRSHDVKLLDTIPETQIPLVDWAVDDRQPLPELSHRDQEIKDSNVWLEKCTISKEAVTGMR